jgi:hypothetical protein
MSVEDKNEIDSNHDNTLSKEDMKRVSRYLSSPLNKIERKPFRVSVMFIMLISIIIFLGVISRIVEWLVIS